MQRMRRLPWSFLLGAAVIGATSAQSAATDLLPGVPCSDSIDTTRFPFASGGYRLVLGAVSVPPRYVGELVDTGERPWRHWLKSGLVVRGDSTGVTITVPAAWRSRVAVGWGNRDGAFSRLRIAGCPARANVGFAYAGGFRLRVRAACVPLSRAARNSDTSRGIGKPFDR
jgi:hypothetical protein